MSEFSETFGAISDVVRTYVEGMVHGDSAKLQAVFHEKACVIGHWDGALGWATLAEFCDEVCGDAARPGEDCYWKINAISTDGDTAVVRVENDWAGIRFDDTLTLLLHEGRWFIVSKLYYARPA